MAQIYKSADFQLSLFAANLLRCPLCPYGSIARTASQHFLLCNKCGFLLDSISSLNSFKQQLKISLGCHHKNCKFQDKFPEIFLLQDGIYINCNFCKYKDFVCA